LKIVSGFLGVILGFIKKAKPQVGVSSLKMRESTSHKVFLETPFGG